MRRLTALFPRVSIAELRRTFSVVHRIRMSRRGTGSPARPAVAQLAKRGLAFLFSEGLVQGLTLLVGILLVRILPIEQFALYTIASSLLNFLTLGSNFGLAQAIVSLGSGGREDRQLVGRLWRAARTISFFAFPFVGAMVLGVAVLMFHQTQWPVGTIALCIILVLAVGSAKIDTMLCRSVFNIYHDVSGTFQIGIWEVVVRMVLASACVLWPLATIALAANLLGALASRRIALRRTARSIDLRVRPQQEQSKALQRFVIPLVPTVLYSLLQGQIGIFLLSAHANSHGIAEFGALSRLGQLFTVFVVVNPFLVQPVFARASSSLSFRRSLLWVSAALLVFCVLVIGSAFLVPSWWLLLLGPNYRGLAHELPLALGGAVLSVAGATLYTIVISRGDTAAQAISILPCLVSQLLYIIYHHYSAPWLTSDALVLGLLPTIVYTVCQAALIVRIIQRWSSELHSTSKTE